MIMQPETLTCPVCQTHLNGTNNCARCGTDLSRLLVVAAQAALIRERAREALRRRRYGVASDLSARAQFLHHTSTGQKLLDMTRILAATRVEPITDTPTSL